MDEGKSLEKKTDVNGRPSTGVKQHGKEQIAESNVVKQRGKEQIAESTGVKQHGKEQIAESTGVKQRGKEQIAESTSDKLNDQQQFIFFCDEINKRSIGRAIIKFCGNEGTENDDNKATLRRLMQAIISHIEKVKPETWKNAEVKIYDDNCDMYSIRAGNGHAVFLATFDGLGNPQVVKTSRSKIDANRNQDKQCLIM